MTTLNRSGKALLVIDVQVGVVQDAYERDEKLANIKTTIAKAREAGIPLVWVQHSDEELELNSDAWQLHPAMEPADGEAIVHKTFRSSFIETNLEEVLAKLNAGHLYICGAETNNCVRHTSHTALDRGYDVTLIGDAHTTTGFEWNGFIVDAARVIDEQNINFFQMELPGRMTNVVSSADLTF